MCGDPDVCRHTSVPWTYSPEAALAWVRRLHAHRAKGTALALAITVPPDDVPVGNVNLVRFSDDRREAALGYWMVPVARGRGLATEAARALCALGFEQLGLERVELAIEPGNEASHAIAARLGAEREGTRDDGLIVYSLRRDRPAPSPPG